MSFRYKLGVCFLTACQSISPTPHAPASNAAIDGMVDIGGVSLHIHCVGRGQPTVIFESGQELSGNDWQMVQAQVGAITRSCVYDRAGTGYSSAIPVESSPSRIAQQLHTLLEKSDVAPTYVVVGHSAGGIYVRQYARQFPLEVTGMVLVDAMPAEATPILRPESEADFDTNVAARLAEVRGARASLGDMPLVVLTRGKPNEMPGISPPLGARLEREWGEMQLELVRLSSNSVQVVARDSGHFLHWDTPHLVVEAIRQVIEASRNSGRVTGVQ